MGQRSSACASLLHPPQYGQPEISSAAVRLVAGSRIQNRSDAEMRPARAVGIFQAGRRLLSAPALAIGADVREARFRASIRFTTSANAHLFRPTAAFDNSNVSCSASVVCLRMS